MALDDNALTSVANAKEAMGITDASKDSLIERLINSASDLIENYCGRTFALTTYTNEKWDGNGDNFHILKNRPLTSVTSISYLSSDYSSDDWEAIDTDFYQYKSNGIVYYQGVFHKGFQNWRITYSAGYAETPHDVEEACIQLVSYLFNAANSFGKQSETLGEYSVTWSDRERNNIFDDLGIDEILDKYKTPVVEG